LSSAIHIILALENVSPLSGVSGMEAGFILWSNSRMAVAFCCRRG
jgi:hypothetical protein